MILTGRYQILKIKEGAADVGGSKADGQCPARATDRFPRRHLGAGVRDAAVQIIDPVLGHEIGIGKVAGCHLDTGAVGVNIHYLEDHRIEEQIELDAKKILCVVDHHIDVDLVTYGNLGVFGDQVHPKRLRARSGRPERKKHYRQSRYKEPRAGSGSPSMVPWMPG